MPNFGRNRHLPPTQPVSEFTPLQAVANQVAVENWGAAQAAKSRLSPVLVTRNYYNPSPNLDNLIQEYRLPQKPLHENFTYAQPQRDRYNVINGQWVSDNGAVYENFIQAAQNAPRPMQYTPELLDYPAFNSGLGAVELKTKWGTVNNLSSYYPGSLLADPKYPDSIYKWNQSTIKLPSGRLINPEKSKRALYDLDQDQYLNSELINERQSLADLEYQQRYAMSSGNKDLTFDSTTGMTELGNGGWIVRPQNQNQQLGEAFNPKPVEMVRYDVERGMGGVSDYGRMPAANRRVQSDSYPMAPLWAREPRSAQIVKLPVPTREEAIAEARLANGLGRSAYRTEQRDLMLQRPGSFNIYTEPEYLKTFASLDSADDAIAGVYSKGKPYQTQVDANGYVTNIPDNLDIHVAGLGYFPLTRGRTLERIPLSKTEPPGQLNGDGTFEMRSKTAGGNPVKAYSMPDDVYERDGNIPFMMDGLQALQAKEQLNNAAWAKYESSLRSPTVSDVEVNQLRSIAEKHKSELESAHGAYSSALNILEPQPNSQKVVTSINVPALGDYPELLRSHGLDIVATNPVGQGIQIQASGYIPIEKQVVLSGELSSRLNRQELVLPRDVSIANANYKAFKEAGIPDGALVRGAKWSMTPDGKPTITDPGVVVGQWEGQRITRGNVKEPTVREIPTAAAPVYELDPEWQQFLEQRNIGKLIQQREKQKDIDRAINSARAKNGLGVLIPTTNEQREAVRITDAVNAVRARNGLPPLGTNDIRQASYREMPSQISSWNNPDYQQAIISQPLQITETNMAPTNLPRIPFNSDFEIEKLNLARASQKYRSGAAQVEQGLPAYGSRSGRAFSQYGKQLPAYNINFEAPADYSYSGVSATPDLSMFLPAATPTVPAPGQLAVRPQPAQAVVRPATVNLNQMPDTIDVQAIPVVDAPHYFRTGIPIEGDDAAWAYNRPPQPVPQPVLVQDPANTWNRYIPAAAALGGLGLGAGIGYTMAPRSSQEEEQQRMQAMQQQMYLQQIRSGRR